MATKGNENTNPTDAVSNTKIPSTATGSKKADASANARHATSLFDIIGTMSKATRLSEEGRRYQERISAEFVTQKRDITALPLVTSRVEATAYVDNSINRAILVIYKETHMVTDSAPPTVEVTDLVNLARQGRPDLKFLPSIVVAPEDYTLPERMAVAIGNAFTTEGGRHGMSSGAMSSLTAELLANANISVVTNLTQVNQFIRNTSPHAIPARADYGVLLSIDDTRKSRHNSATGQVEYEKIPILAIAGYTAFFTPEETRRTQHGQPLNFAPGYEDQLTKPVPLATISEVVSTIPSSELMALVYPIAASLFIVQSQCYRPYTTLAKGAPNIGNLMIDQNTNAPMELKNIQDVEGYVRTCLHRPYLAVNITEGRVRAIGIEELLYDPASMLTRLNNFYRGLTPTPGKDMFESTLKPASYYFETYTGHYVEEGRVVSTQNIDYLNLMARGADPQTIESLLFLPKYPAARLELTESMVTGAQVKSLYSTVTVVLDAGFVNKLNAARTCIPQLNLHYDMTTNNVPSISALAGTQANDYSQLYGAIGGGTVGTPRVNPYNYNI